VVLVAEAPDGLAGFMATAVAEAHLVLDAPVTLRITDAYVAPADRRRGIGRGLFTAVEQRAHDGGVAVLEVGTLALDGRAVAFWRALGFGDWRMSLQRPAVATSGS
jgi:GNAT superfamily N-acetyltransferase